MYFKCRSVADYKGGAAGDRVDRDHNNPGRVKNYQNYEKTVSSYGKKKNVDGIICGHIHKASNQNFDGVNYLNCGDWVENCTALVEHLDGKMEIIKWDEIRQEVVNYRTQLKEVV